MWRLVFTFFLALPSLLLSTFMVQNAFADPPQQCIITTIAGNENWGFSGDGGPAVNAQFHIPMGVAVDAAGNIYIADIDNNRIRKITTDGRIDTIAGNGIEGFSGDGGHAVNAQISYPQDVAVDVAGNIYISDTGNHRIRKVTTDGRIGTIAGNGRFGYSGDGGLAVNARITTPFGVAVDTVGNIYISDSYHNRIRKVTPSGIISTIAGSDITGGFSGDGGLAVNAQIYGPDGIDVDAAGNIYIADKNNNRIRKITTDGRIDTIAGNGISSFSGDGGHAVNAQIFSPGDIAVDTAGNIYIADVNDHRIRKVTTDGRIGTIAGNGISSFSGDNGPADRAQIALPTGIAVDTVGNIYISDMTKIRKVTCTPTHLACQNNQCVQMAGAGSNQCSTHADCQPRTHSECRNNQCMQVSGAGANQCTTAVDCFHLECRNNSCAPTPGAGANQCNTNSDCQPQGVMHAACNNLLQCVQVPGAGENTCASDQNCKACVDTDGGNNPALAGWAVTTKNRRITGTFKDTCKKYLLAGRNITKLMEFYCMNGKVRSQVYDCQSACTLDRRRNAACTVSP